MNKFQMPLKDLDLNIFFVLMKTLYNIRFPLNDKIK